MAPIGEKFTAESGETSMAGIRQNAVAHRAGRNATAAECDGGGKVVKLHVSVTHRTPATCTRSKLQVTTSSHSPNSSSAVISTFAFCMISVSMSECRL